MKNILILFFLIFISSQAFPSDNCVEGIEAYKTNQLKKAQKLLEDCQKDNGLNKQSSYILNKIYKKTNNFKRVEKINKTNNYNNQIIFEAGKSENLLESGSEWFINYKNLYTLKNNSNIILDTYFKKENRNYKFGSFSDSIVYASINQNFKNFNYKIKASTIIDKTKSFYSDKMLGLNIGARFNDLHINLEYENNQFDYIGYDIDLYKILFKYNFFKNQEIGLRFINGKRNSFEEDPIGSYGVYLKLNMRKVTYTIDFEEGKSFDPLIYSEKYNQLSNKFSFKINDEYDLYGKQSFFNNDNRDEMRYSLGLSWKF